MRVFTFLTGALATTTTAAAHGGRGGGGVRGGHAPAGRGRGAAGGHGLAWLLSVMMVFMLVASTEGRHTQAPTHQMADLPSVVIRSVNVTSLEAHWDELEELSWDLLLVQEPRVAPDSYIFRRAAAQGIQVRPGQRTPAGDLLVCAFCRRGSLGANLPQGNVELGRAQYFTWHPGGPCSWRIFNHYCEADGSAAALARTSAALRWSVAEAESRREIPALVAGDFNALFEELDCAFAIHGSGWHDLGGTAGTSSASILPRRIDWLLANPAMQRRFRHHELSWSSGVTTHALQALELAAGQLPNAPH